jgi:hypothetical protein
MENNLNEILKKLKEYENLLLSDDDGDDIDENLSNEINHTKEQLNQ